MICQHGVRYPEPGTVPESDLPLKVLEEEQPSPEFWGGYKDKPKYHKNKCKHRKISPEEVAIAKGIIKIRPEVQSKEEKI
jgi:hypothetical protein